MSFQCWHLCIHRSNSTSTLHCQWIFYSNCKLIISKYALFSKLIWLNFLSLKVQFLLVRRKTFLRDGLWSKFALTSFLVRYVYSSWCPRTSYSQQARASQRSLSKFWPFFQHFLYLLLPAPFSLGSASFSWSLLFPNYQRLRASNIM